jgi:S-formylglutathione hydrolase FrmB
MSIETRATHRVHGGTLIYAQHQSVATRTPMRFSIFMPPGDGPFPYLIWLSGLTCTEDNFTTKAGAYGHAAKHGVAIIAPDTCRAVKAWRMTPLTIWAKARDFISTRPRRPGRRNSAWKATSSRI